MVRLMTTTPDSLPEQNMRTRGTLLERARALTDVVDARDRQMVADEWVVKRVQLAREIGCSWSEIAEVFGITRSAAFQRYAHLPPAGYIRPVGPRP